jgi:hypothetical protein
LLDGRRSNGHNSGLSGSYGADRKKGGRVNGSNGPHIETDSAILQHHEACRGVQTATEATEAAEENDTDRIQPERQKAILKPHVTVNQAAKKLYDYEQTGLSPHEVANLVEQVQNLTRRVKKYESWEE